MSDSGVVAKVYLRLENGEYVAKWEGELLSEEDAEALSRKLDAEAALAMHALPETDPKA